jgi:HEAT repeat protein
MRRLGPSLAAFTLVVSLPALASVASAHGGRYIPPAGEVPEGSRPTEDPPPPPEGGPPSTPGGDNPGGPTTGGPDPSGPSTPGGGPAGGGAPQGPGPNTGGGAPQGPKTGGRGPAAAKSPGLGSWMFWWAANKDELLRVKRAVIATQRGTITGASFGAPAKGGVRTVTDEAIRTSIVPALRKLLADESEHFHVRSAAELGLAKIGDADSVEALRRMAANEGRVLHREVEETAALALGVMQRDDAGTCAFLIDVVRDQAKDASFARPFSAVSLGLLGDANDREHAATSAMVAVIARKEAGADVKPACLMGLGLLGDEAAIPELLWMVLNGKAAAAGSVELTQIETAYAVAALGKIGRAGVGTGDDGTCVLDEIVRIVDKYEAKGVTDVRRSAVIALGQIGPKCTAKQQRRVVDTLRRLLDAEVEEQQRDFALISLARIGATPGVDGALRRDVVAAVGKVMEKSKGQTPAFAAMALGLVGRAVVAEGRTPEEDIRAPLRERFSGNGDPQIRGAYALASGLTQDPLAVPAMLAALKDRGTDKRVRGWCALALGLIGDRTAVDAVRDTLRTEADRDLRVQVAMAAGLLGDATVVEDLVTVVRNPDSSNYELGSAALALGQIGDERAVAALLDIATDTERRYADLTRGLAIVALGQIGDRRDVPVLSRVWTDVNYRAHVPAITELLTIL